LAAAVAAAPTAHGRNVRPCQGHRECTHASSPCAAKPPCSCIKGLLEEVDKKYYTLRDSEWSLPSTCLITGGNPPVKTPVRCSDCVPRRGQHAETAGGGEDPLARKSLVA
jgi:hypothetical protein